MKPWSLLELFKTALKILKSADLPQVPSEFKHLESILIADDLRVCWGWWKAPWNGPRLVEKDTESAELVQQHFYHKQLQTLLSTLKHHLMSHFCRNHSCQAAKDPQFAKVLMGAAFLTLLVQYTNKNTSWHIWWRHFNAKATAVQVELHRSFAWPLCWRSSSALWSFPSPRRLVPFVACLTCFCFLLEELA